MQGSHLTFSGRHFGRRARCQADNADDSPFLTDLIRLGLVASHNRQLSTHRAVAIKEGSEIIA
jgi:hypothetical protein